MPGESRTALTDVLKKYWGYDGFLPLQPEAMTCVMDGGDSIVVLPTGGGKSLCFQAPAMCLDGLAIVISPLISLMKDQVDALTTCGVPAACINSTMSYAEKGHVANEIRAGRLRLLYMAPERLVQSRTIEFLRSANVSMVAIDEAHCISEWGHDFRPEYRELKMLKEVFPGVGIHAYTATATDKVRADIAANLGLDDPEILVGSFDRPNLTYRVEQRTDRLGQVLEVIERHKGESGIVYCLRRKDVDKLTQALTEMKIRALPYHAGLSDDQRHRNQDAFIEEKVDVVVATVAFGMGIDKSNVRFVVHAAMPKSIENYQQESGRAGRDGLEAECCLLYSGGDMATLKWMLSDLEGDAYKAAAKSLDAIFNFCAGVVCRHRALVTYFGQEYPQESCNACDVCLGDLDLVDEPLIVGQKILSCVVRLKESFGGDYTAKVLAGSGEQRIKENGHDQLSTWGLLKDDSRRNIRDWVEQLVGQGYLRKAGEFNVLEITDSGRQLLKGESEPRLLQPRTAKSKSQSAAADDSWEGVDRDLFELLRTLRRETAEQLDVPAYVVFGDATLRDMARRRPSSLDGLLNVKGVGEKKRTDYGETFLACIVEYCSENEMATDVEPSLTSPRKAAASRPRRGPSSSARKSFEFFESGNSVEQVAESMGRAKSTVNAYLREYLTHATVEDPSPWVDAETTARVEQALEHVDGDRLKPVFDHLDGEVSYDQLRIVATCRQNRQAVTEGSATNT
jgi:ATP-dependent DNA helicase RecQ